MKIVVGMPCMDTLPMLTCASLLRLCMSSKHELIPFFVSGSLVYDARNDIVNEALKERADYILFIDSDITFEPDALDKLLAHNTDIVSGLYFGRREHNNNPIAYSKIYPKTLFRKCAKLDTIKDVDAPLQEVAAAGLGFCLIKMNVFYKMLCKNNMIFEPFRGMGEDISFFYRAKKMGFKVFLDSTIPLTHIGYKRYGKNDYLQNLM